MSKWRRSGSCEVNCLLPGRLELRPAITKIGRQRLRQWSLATGGLSLTVVLLRFWENNEYHSTRDAGAPLVAALRYLMLVLTCLQLLLLICIQRIEKQWNWRCSLLELLLVLPVPLPYYDSELRMRQLGQEMIVSLDDMILPFTCLRLYHLFNSLKHFSFLSKSRTDFQIDLHKVPSKATFLVKSFMHYKSVHVLIAAITTNVLVTGLLLRAFERTVTGHSEQLDYIWNGLWLAQVSDDVIGYGDIVPKTHIGRGLISVSILIGIVTISYTVGIVCKVISLESKELRLFASILAKRFASRDLSQAAANLIQATWKLHERRQKQISRIHEVWRLSLAVHKFKFQRSRCKAKSEPTFRDQLYYFEKEIRPHITSVTNLLPAIYHSDNLVSSSSGQELYLQNRSRYEETECFDQRLENTEEKYWNGTAG